jgi:hypothetical protein
MRGPDADGARAHGAKLVRIAVAWRNRAAGIRAERGVHAVDGLIAGRQRIDHGPRARDAGDRPAGDGNLRAVAGDADDVGDADAAARKRDRPYLTTPLDFRKARATSLGSCFSPSTL